jgi:hypothetical protein
MDPQQEVDQLNENLEVILEQKCIIFNPTFLAINKTFRPNLQGAGKVEIQTR